MNINNDKTDPLLNSPTGVTVHCTTCNRKMNHRYFYNMNANGSVRNILCPVCYDQISYKSGFKKHISKSNKDVFKINQQPWTCPCGLL